MISINQIKELLPKTFRIFFGKFERLKEIQEKTIPIVILKKNAIIVSSTSSGKTEAVLAPLVELLLKEKWQPLSILWIVPTRALVNDLYERIKSILKHFSLEVDKKTADFPKIDYKKIPDIIITTPESTDSLLCRHPNIFYHLQAIVIDEIHFLDGNYRGDQLRILLKRIQEISKNDFNIYLLSATVIEPDIVAKRYIHKEFEVITSSEKREIVYSLLPINDYEDVPDVLFDFLKNEPHQKILAFCNRKVLVEMMSAIFKRSLFWKDYSIVIHHGDLSKKYRIEVEETIKKSKKVICISSSTLEIGIDIGDISLAVLIETPFTISSLLQRIGRSNRKENTIRAVGFFGLEVEFEILSEMFELAKQGILDGYEYVPDPGVIVQQILSLLYANRNGLTFDTFYETLRPLLIDFAIYYSKFTGLFPKKEDSFESLEKLAMTILKQILDYLLDKYKNYIGYSETYFKYYPREKTLNLGNQGLVHSNIPIFKEYKIIDIYSKKEIGVLAAFPARVFYFAGKCWKIVDYEDNKIFVKEVTYPEYEITVRATSTLSKYYTYLPDKYRILI